LRGADTRPPRRVAWFTIADRRVADGPVWGVTFAGIRTINLDSAFHFTLRRLGTPEDIACAVRSFASDDAAWITGQTISVDGGHWMRG
jgi:NAD(P)-dependent dehydrogenase (short-subunit alcohol dehydrogenase family)